MDSEDKNYECQLDEYSLKKAITELHEDPKQRLSSVQTLRTWVRSQPHFTCRTDTSFLLQVLRTAKFSQLRAREIIETMLTLRTKYPEFVVNVDTHETNIALFLDKAYILPLPKRDREGRRLIILRPGVIDAGDPRMNLVNEFRTFMCVQELLKENDESGFVNGLITIYDMTGAMGTKQFSRYGPETVKKGGKIYQDCNTGRMKGTLIYNGGVFFEFLMSLLSGFLKKKLLDRIHTYSTMEGMYSVVPMDLWPDEYLPDDYKGPSAGPIKDLAADVKRRLMDPAFRARLLDYSSDRYRIDEKKKIIQTPQESFRKLNID